MSFEEIRRHRGDRERNRKVRERGKKKD